MASIENSSVWWKLYQTNGKTICERRGIMFSERKEIIKQYLEANNGRGPNTFYKLKIVINDEILFDDSYWDMFPIKIEGINYALSLFIMCSEIIKKERLIYLNESKTLKRAIGKTCEFDILLNRFSPSYLLIDNGDNCFIIKPTNFDERRNDGEYEYELKKM